MSKRNIPEEEQIIDDHFELFLAPQMPKKVKDMLIISGGGVSATFFTMGAVKCLIDNDMLNFDVMSSVSGGTLLLHFVEQSYHQGYTKEDNWYEKYIRKPFYDVTREPLFAKLLINGFTPKGLQKTVLELLQGPLIAYYNKPLDVNKLYKKTIFEYNYLAGNGQHISDDHRDLIDLEKGVKQDNWYTYRLMRCTLPYTKFNDIPAFDAGSADNSAFSTTLSKYEAQNVFYIASDIDFVYKKYPKKSYLKDISGVLTAVVNASSKASVHLATITLDKKNVILCKYSNGHIKSEDKYHKDLFNDYYTETPRIKTFYNGVLFTDHNMLKVIENEGYIQMYYGIKKSRGYKNKKLEFKIPNSDVYNEKVGEIFDNFQKLNVNKEIMKSIMSEIKNRIFKKK